MNKCTGCFLDKENECFFRCKKSKDGLRSQCKDCEKKNYLVKREKMLLYKKQYYTKNKERLNSLHKQWVLENTDLKKQMDADHYKNNKDRIIDNVKKYRELNKELINKKNKIYYNSVKNSISFKQKRKQYFEKNRLKINEQMRKKNKDDIQSKIKSNLRKRLGKVLKGLVKSGSSVDDLGCDICFLKKHLESKFQSGMTWDNYGKWHIDHIKPLSRFDLTDREQFLKACNYTNLQPLWALDNIRKGNR